jgi:hypothetical protein
MEVLDKEVYLQGLMGEVTQIVAFLEQAVEAREAVHEVERGLWKRMLDLGQRCLELFFNFSGSGDQGAELCLPGRAMGDFGATDPAGQGRGAPPESG